MVAPLRVPLDQTPLFFPWQVSVYHASKGAFHLSGMAELKELVLAGVSGKGKSTPREHARASCAVSRVFNAKRIGNYFATSSVIFPRISRVVRAGA